MPPRQKTDTTSNTSADTSADTGKTTDTVSAPLDAVKRNIAVATAVAWMPEEGAILTAQLVVVKKGESEYGPYPILVMNPVGDESYENTGKFYAIHAFHSILQNELLTKRPTPGEMLTIAYMGQRETNESERKHRAATKDAKTDMDLSKAEQDRTFYHLYVLLDGDGTGADAVTVEEFNWDTDTKKAASAE